MSSFSSILFWTAAGKSKKRAGRLLPSGPLFPNWCRKRKGPGSSDEPGRGIYFTFSYTQNSQFRPPELNFSLLVCSQSGRESRLGK